MRLFLLWLVLSLVLCSSLGAETIILDSGDTQDWARIMSSDYPKYKDTLIRPTALLKFVTGDIPSTAVITHATLYFKRVKTVAGATITVSYVSDDSWTFDKTDAGDLYGWHVNSFIGSYQTGG